MLSILPKEMEAIRVSQEKMIEKETKSEQVKVPKNSTISKPKDQISEETDKKSNPVKVEVKSNGQPRDSVTVDNKKGLDVHVPINTNNLNSLQGLVNIHFHIYQK